MKTLLSNGVRVVFEIRWIDRTTTIKAALLKTISICPIVENNYNVTNFLSLKWREKKKKNERMNFVCSKLPRTIGPQAPPPPPVSARVLVIVVMALIMDNIQGRAMGGDGVATMFLHSNKINWKRRNERSKRSAEIIKIANMKDRKCEK